MQLPELEGKALDAIVAGPLAWSTAKDLVRLGHTTETLEALETAGLVARWELPRETAWTLTPFGAWSLGREIVEVGSQEDPRWGWPAEMPKFQRVIREHGHYAMKLPELIADKTPGPEFLIDPVDEEPLILFGRTVVIDKRLKGPPKGGAKTRKAKKPKGKRAKLKASA